MVFDTVREHLERRGYTVKIFSTGMEAATYLDSVIDRTTVGIGSSGTIDDIGLYERLVQHNTVYWHWRSDPAEAQRCAMDTEVYLTSVNALAESGEMVNIDATGNRVASTLFGHKRVYFVIGQNKLVKTYEDAVWRARNIAAPKNAQRLGKKTPCAVKGDRCYDCNSPESICCGLVTLWRPTLKHQAEVILIEEDHGL